MYNAMDTFAQTNRMVRGSSTCPNVVQDVFCKYQLITLFAENAWTSWTPWACDQGNNTLSRSRSCPKKAFLTRPKCPYGDDSKEQQPCQGK